ncbi:MAG: tetratricopeptide repeat protein [Patescibacteria group bacterium]|nr:tetratricopeptide repeat protein [Patescibacteria group bacterium]
MRNGGQRRRQVPGRLAGAKPKRNPLPDHVAGYGEDAIWLACLPESVKPYLAVREAVLCCPTCKAKQAPSLECRRCKSDLSLVVAVHDQLRRLHAAVLRQLATGRYAEAARTARSYWMISPEPAAARLLAVCCLLQGAFPAAQGICDSIARASDPARGHSRW